MFSLPRFDTAKPPIFRPRHIQNPSLPSGSYQSATYVQKQLPDSSLPSPRFGVDENNPNSNTWPSQPLVVAPFHGESHTVEQPETEPYTSINSRLEILRTTSVESDREGCPYNLQHMYSAPYIQHPTYALSPKQACLGFPIVPLSSPHRRDEQMKQETKLDKPLYDMASSFLLSNTSTTAETLAGGRAEEDEEAASSLEQLAKYRAPSCSPQTNNVVDLPMESALIQEIKSLKDLMYTMVKTPPQAVMTGRHVTDSSTLTETINSVEEGSRVETTELTSAAVSSDDGSGSFSVMQPDKHLLKIRPRPPPPRPRPSKETTEEAECAPTDDSEEQEETSIEEEEEQQQEMSIEEEEEQQEEMSIEDDYADDEPGAAETSEDNREDEPAPPKQSHTKGTLTNRHKLMPNNFPTITTRSSLPVLSINGAKFSLTPLSQPTIQHHNPVHIYHETRRCQLGRNDDFQKQREVPTRTPARNRVVAEKKQLVQRCEELTVKVAELRGEIQQTNKTLTIEREQSKATQNQLTEEVMELRLSREHLNQLLSVQESHLKNAHDTVDKLQGDRQRMDRQLVAVERLEHDQAQIIRDLKKTETLNREIIEKLEKEKDALETRFAKAKSELETATEQLQKHEEQSSKLHAEVERLRAQLPNKLETETHRAMGEIIKQQERKLETQENEIVSIKNELVETTSAKQQVEKELKETTAEITTALLKTKTKLQDEIQKQKKLKAEIDSTRESLLKTTREKSRLQARISFLEKHMEGYDHHRMLEMESELSRLRMHLDDADTKLEHYRQLEKEGPDPKELKALIQELEVTNEQLETDLSMTLSASRELRDRVAELESTGRLLSAADGELLLKAHQHWQFIQAEEVTKRQRRRQVSILRLSLGVDKPVMSSSKNAGVQVGKPRAIVIDSTGVSPDTKTELSGSGASEKATGDRPFTTRSEPVRSTRAPVWRANSKYKVDGRVTDAKLPQQSHQSAPLLSCQLPTHASLIRRQNSLAEVQLREGHLRHAKQQDIKYSRTASAVHCRLPGPIFQRNRHSQRLSATPQESPAVKVSEQNVSEQEVSEEEVSVAELSSSNKMRKQALAMSAKIREQFNECRDSLLHPLKRRGTHNDNEDSSSNSGSNTGDDSAAEEQAQRRNRQSSSPGSLLEDRTSSPSASVEESTDAEDNILEDSAPVKDKMSTRIISTLPLSNMSVTESFNEGSVPSTPDFGATVFKSTTEGIPACKRRLDEIRQQLLNQGVLTH